MKKFFLFLLVILINSSSIAITKTEITTDKGIEIFQNEKYYLLTGNVQINSKDFILSADIVKAYFDKDLYDIVEIQSYGNSSLTSQKGIKAKGDKIIFLSSNNSIVVKGTGSYLSNGEIEMYSDNFISIDNSIGFFKIKGENSKLINKDTIMVGGLIEGMFEDINGSNELTNLNLEDKNIVNIKTKKINMFGKRAIYNKKNDLIELFENVKITRNKETVTGDYAKIDLLTESYKVSSKSTSNKVKIILENNE